MPSPSRHALIVGILALIGFAFVSDGLVRRAWGRGAALLEPWQRALAASGLPADGGKPVRALDELDNAQAELALLRGRLAEYDSIRGEGGVDPRSALLCRSRILSRSNRQGRRYSELDAGAVDRVVKGMAVIVGWSLVGVVDGVVESRCLVQEVTDAQSRVPALLMDGGTVVGEGVLAGTGRRGELSLEFIEDRQGLEVHPGEQVVSAATPPGIPRGLVLGTVVEASRSATTDHWRIAVAPLRLMESTDSVALLSPAVSPP